jgi:hypothetical protein
MQKSTPNCTVSALIIVVLSVRRGIVPHIIQIAAMESRSKEKFSRNVCPELPISSKAERVTGITWSGEVLSYRGEPVC